MRSGPTQESRQKDQETSTQHEASQCRTRKTASVVAPDRVALMKYRCYTIHLLLVWLALR